MALSVRRALLYTLLALSALGSSIFWVAHSLRSRNELGKAAQLASISLPTEPSLLAWSPDGRYLVAGTGYTQWSTVSGPGKVFIVDVGKKAIAATLETAGRVDGLAFSPDGKWLAIATITELVVFAFPEFTAKAKLKSGIRKNKLNDKSDVSGIFLDIAWAADGNSLFTIDGDSLGVMMESKLRRWSAPEFVEKQAIALRDIGQYKALAVAPNGHTVALVAQRGQGPGVLEILELDKGTKIFSVEDLPLGYYRAGFSADGKAVGVFAGIEGMPLLGDILEPNGKQRRKHQTMSWWDVAIGEPASPAKPRFAVPPAAQAESRTYSISPDTRIWAHALLFRFPDEDSPNVVLTQTDGANTWGWQVGMAKYDKQEVVRKLLPRPSLAFSPDGTKLAGTLETPSGWTIAIWAVP